MRNKLFIIILFALSGALGFLLSWHQHREIEKDEIQIVKTVHYPAVFAQQLIGDPDAGRKIYKEFCASCHAAEPIIDAKAPLISDKKEWKKRRKKGMNALMKVTLEGKNAMPARGGCFECSDEQLRQAVQYIVNQSR